MSDPVETTVAQQEPVQADPAAPDPVAGLVADLDALWARHVPDSLFSRDTGAHNRLHALFAQIRETAAEVRR